MELALYCPNVGYYEQEADNIGRRGDFFTSVSVGSVFGEMLAFRFAEWMDGFKVQGSKFKVVEAGAHDGKLARDIFNWLGEFRPELFEKLEYSIIEPSAKRREWQKNSLRDFQKQVAWVSSLDELKARTGSVTGIIFSNELLDALPVHRLGWDSRKDEWFEWGVVLRDGNFSWERKSEKFPVEFCFPEGLPDGFTIELGSAADSWWKDAANLLDSGKLLAIDYGLTTSEIFSPARKDGTLRAYKNHRLNPDVLSNPGEQDITAHINFDALQIAGEKAGLKTDALVTQEKFLNGIVARTAANPAGFAEWSSPRARQLQTLVHPEHLGRAFRVLVQSR